MKKKLKALFILLFLTAILILPYFVFAEDQPPIGPPPDTAMPASSISPLQKLNVVTSGSYADTNEFTFAALLGQLVNAFLSLLAIIFIILIILGGYNWLTASGNEQSVEKAKNTIIRAVIGLLIILSAWAIWIFILRSGIIASTLK